MVVGALGSRQFRLGLCSLKAECLCLGLCFGDVRQHFRRLERHEHLALLDGAPSIHGDALHEAGELRVDRNGEVRLKLTGQLDLPLHRLRRHADDVNRRLSRRGRGD